MVKNFSQNFYFSHFVKNEKYFRENSSKKYSFEFALNEKKDEKSGMMGKNVGT